MHDENRSVLAGCPVAWRTRVHDAEAGQDVAVLGDDVMLFREESTRADQLRSVETGVRILDAASDHSSGQRERQEQEDSGAWRLMSHGGAS